MVHDDGKFMVFWQFIFSLLVYINFLYAPFITAFSALRVSYRSTVQSFEFFIEYFWILAIIINFLTASTERKIFTFNASARRYMQSYGIFDICAVLGNLYVRTIAKTSDPNTEAIILFIRFTHFAAIFYPVKYYIRNYTMLDKKREKYIKNKLEVFVLMLFFSHILACYLIILGHDKKDQEKNERQWIRQNQDNFKEQPEG